MKTQRPDKCSKCGFCKAVCPSFAILKKESMSPRGRAILTNKGVLDVSFYNCTICKACLFECPSSVDLDLENTRERIVKAGIETEANKKMIENIRKFDNPLGEKPEESKELYCC